MPGLSTNSALWLTRAAWLSTAVLNALAIASAADGRSARAENVTLIGWWTMAAVVVVALVACGPLGVTTLRISVPTGAIVAVAALVAGASTVSGAAALIAATVTVAVAFAPETAEACLQVAAYGDERRLPLRPPAAMQAPMLVAWVVWVVVCLTGVLLLSAGRYLLAVPTLALAAAITWALVGRLRRFACRWLVCVPAGLVVHDPVVLAETLMVMRANVLNARLALADTEACDLTGPSAGHALEIALRTPVPVVLAPPRNRQKAAALQASAILVAPTRPGRALRALAERNVAVV